MRRRPPQSHFQHQPPPPEHTPFELRVKELDDIKTVVLKHMGRLNALKLQYMDWFERRRQTFVDAVKLIQITLPQLVPQKTNTLREFRKAHEVASRLPKRGLPVENCASVMGEYLVFWDRLLELHKTGQELYARVVEYISKISAMREPHILDTVHDLQSTLNTQTNESFDFTTVHNERDNLFTYKVAQHDHQYHGLLAYPPYLLKMACTLCFWCNKMHLERE
ncbi:hypothetical protein PoB_006088400 [Plakobranchus ocellatus]|uniref:Dynein heavy chain tail domain-containing protein n=1 Tax=Plakobranchus ocellatus TaxID=259542 RepID=A0AAV4CR93_9GAST|nr:hypothetical protein PoB_006088400 [Plakobranchus ocellatus]